MPRATFEKEIGSVRYRMQTLGMFAASAALIHVTHLLGAELMKVWSNGLEALDKGEGLEALVTSFVSRPAKDQIESLHYLTEVFASVTEVGETPRLSSGALGKPVWSKLDDVDDHFAGELRNFAVWFACCLQKNFASFLGGERSETSSSPKPPSDTETAA